MEGTEALVLPRRTRGRHTDAADADYQEKLEDFCRAIREIDSRLNFKVSSRG
jgi:hypothetical protein